MPIIKAAMNVVLQEFAKLNLPVHHLAGNHDLYHIERLKLQKLLSIKSEENFFYYEFSPHPTVRIVCLDAYDISLWGRSSTHPKVKEATEFLSTHNPNTDKTSYSNLEG